MLVAAIAGTGAARMPSAEPGLCIPLLMQCGTQPAPGDPLGGLLPPLSDAPGVEVPPVVALPDPNAPVFTLPAAQLGGSSISFSGLQAVSVVTVRLANGTMTPALKLVADDIVIQDFLLDVRRATGPSLVTNATTMHLHGHVQVYVDSLTATLLGGAGISVGALTPPPGDELPSQLLRVNLGLVGVTADSITFTAPHQSLKE